MIEGVYYDGDSYSCFGVEKNTGHFLAEHFNCPLVHQGRNGKSPAEIIKDFLTIDHNTNILYFIGIGISSRNIELEESGSIRTLSQAEYVKKFGNTLLTEDHHTIVDILLLSGYCKSKNLKHLIHNLDYKNFEQFNAMPGYENIIKEFIINPNIVGFFDNLSLHHLMKQHNLPGFDADQYRDMSHPTEAGHKMYADFLKSKIPL